MAPPLPPAHWSTLPPPVPAPAPPRRRLAPYFVPLLFVVLLWVLGLHELAAVVAVAVTVVTILSAVSPAFRTGFDRVVAAVGRTVGRALTFVLLGIVQLVIFTPASAAARLLRTDPLDPFTRQGRASRWLTRPAERRDLHARPYGDERYRREAAGTDTVVGSPRWIRGFVGGVVLLLVADIALGSLLVWFDRDDGDGAGPAVFGFEPAAQEALATQPGAAELMAELEAAGLGDLDPFTGWRFGEGVTHESAALNIIDGARVSRLSTLEGELAEVWFLGGSTMYGSGQSDEATIPSASVESADAAGVGIRATNLGHPAYANWQQVLLLERELTAGVRSPPDVVVFYDGFNDLTLQTQFGVHQEPTHLFFGVTAPTAEPNRSVAATVRTWWADHSAAALAVGRVADLFTDDEPVLQVAEVDASVDTIDPVAAADAAVAIHRRGVDHVLALGEAYDFEPLFFWQPYLYTRDPLTPAEQELVDLPGYATDVWVPMTERVRATLADPVVDLSDALDGEPTPLFWDFVHTNEHGAALVAAAIHPHLVDAVTEATG